MTKMKKLVSLMLAALMLLSMMSVAGADGTCSITVNNAKAGETYTIYKLFDLSVSNDGNAYTYSINSAWADFFQKGEEENPDGAGLQYVTIENGYVTQIGSGENDTTTAAALAKAAAEWSDKPSGASQVVVDDGATIASFTGLENGYYLITSTLGTVAMTETTPDATTVTINEKNPENTIVKVVKEENSWVTASDAQIGEVVAFKSTATLYPGTRNVVIHDTMETGLDFVEDSIVIKFGETTLEAGKDYNLNPTDYTCEDSCTFHIVFAETYINGLSVPTELTITYSATLTEGVLDQSSGVAIIPQTNTTQITYGDDQSVESQTTTTTHKFSVHKYTGEEVAENDEPTTWLAGAVFSLKKAGTVVPLVMIDNNNYRVAKTGETNTTNTFVTVESGNIVIWGVDSDADYALDEINPPAGYNELADDVTVTVNADNSTHMNVVNNTGAELPSTGGIGTTIFYAVGGLLVVLAVVLLVTKRRVSEEG